MLLYSLKLSSDISTIQPIPKRAIILPGTDATKHQQSVSLEFLSGDCLCFSKQLFAEAVMLSGPLQSFPEGDFGTKNVQLPDHRFFFIYPQPQ